MRRNSAKRSRMPPLTMSFRWMTPSSRSSLATASGVPPWVAMRSAIAVIWRTASDTGAARKAACAPPAAARRTGAVEPPCAKAIMASTAPLRIATPPTSMPLIRVCAENGTKRASSGAISRPRKPVFLLGEDDDRAAFRGLVGQRGDLRRIGEFAFLDPGQRDELGRLAISQGDRAGLVEQQGVDIARRLDRTARHRQYIEAHQPVHAGNADRRQQRADRRRDQTDKQRRQHDDRNRTPGIRRQNSGSSPWRRQRSGSCRRAGC